MRIIKLEKDVYFRSRAAVGGYEEMRGRIGKSFDFCDESDKFGQNTWELAEGEMARVGLNIAMNKAKIAQNDLDFLVAGDLQNQCVATSVGLSSFGIPYLGIYGACSTCTEALLITSLLLQNPGYKMGAVVTSSHNCAAERQFRTPLEYGGQRTGTAQWTATAAGAFILQRDEKPKNLFPTASDYPNNTTPEGTSTEEKIQKKGRAVISEVMIGKIVNGETTDASNMGGAMAFSAADTILSYFKESGASVSDIDLIITGDLGLTGSKILREILEKENPLLAKKHEDCGLILYDEKLQDVHSGASGCGTSASVLAAHFLPKIENGNIKNVLFLSTGALMSPSSVLQKQSIYGIAPLIKISHKM